MNTGIPVPSLRLIWELCDIEKKGQLNVEEFALALFLSEMAKKGIDFFPLIIHYLIPY
jgi:hypothetical protein